MMDSRDLLLLEDGSYSICDHRRPHGSASPSDLLAWWTSPGDLPAQHLPIFFDFFCSLKEGERLWVEGFTAVAGRRVDRRQAGCTRLRKGLRRLSNFNFLQSLYYVMFKGKKASNESPNSLVTHSESFLLSISLMARNSEAGEASRHSPPSETRRSPDPFLVVCRCFSVITAITALLCVVANILSAIRSFKHGTDIFGGIFRCYVVALAIFVAVVETEWDYILRFWKVLEYWPGRGMLQIFVAVMTRAFPDTSGQRRDLIMVQEISSYLLLACGLIYAISGVLCIGYLKRARQHRETSRVQAAKDLEELERRKRELEALLIAESDQP